MVSRTLSALLTLLLVVGAFGALASFPAPGASETGHTAADDAGHSFENQTLATAEDVTIVFTVFRPANASNESTVPLVLHSHGWGGSRASEIGGIVEDLLDAGYGVLSFDARGHGDSTGLATIHHKDHEVQDIIKLIDWAHDELDWVTHEGDEGAKDLVLGAVGGSYGGGYQLMTASYDGRLDAIVPQMTWNDLRYSLAPNGVVKSTWVDALYGVGLSSIDMHPNIHQWFAEATLTNRLPAAAAAHLLGSSPIPGDIQAATLLVQGLPDALFNWNEAVRNYNGIRAGGNDDVALVGYLGGHVLPHVQPIGFMGPPRGGEPCGAYGDLALAWFSHHLKGNATVEVPSGVTYATEQGTCVHKDSAESEDDVTFWLADLPALNPAGTLLVPLQAPAGTIGGVPMLHAEVLGATELLFAVGLAIQKPDGRLHIVDDQAAFARVPLGPSQFKIFLDLEMTGVATELDEGDQLFLRVDGLHEWAPTGAGRTPGAALLQNVSVRVPYLA